MTIHITRIFALLMIPCIGYTWYIMAQGDEFTRDKDRVVTVVDRLIRPGGSKSDGDFIIVVEYQSKQFDFEVSPTTYSKATRGKNLTFEFSDQELAREMGEETHDFRYSFGPGLWIIISLTATIVICLIAFDANI